MGGVHLQMAQVLCQKLSFFTFRDKQTCRRGWEKEVCRALWIHNRGDRLRSAEVLHSERSSPCKQEQGFLVGLIVLSDSSLLPPLLLSFQNTISDERRDIVMLQLIFEMFLSEGIPRQPLLSFLHPLNNCEIKVGGRKYEVGF